jgi:hypothetical protein
MSRTKQRRVVFVFWVQCVRACVRVCVCVRVRPEWCVRVVHEKCLHDQDHFLKVIVRDASHFLKVTKGVIIIINTPRDGTTRAQAFKKQKEKERKENASRSGVRVVHERCLHDQDHFLKVIVREEVTFLR